MGDLATFHWVLQLSPAKAVLGFLVGLVVVLWTWWRQQPGPIIVFSGAVTFLALFVFYAVVTNVWQTVRNRRSGLRLIVTHDGRLFYGDGLEIIAEDVKLLELTLSVKNFSKTAEGVQFRVWSNDGIAIEPGSTMWRHNDPATVFALIKGPVYRGDSWPIGEIKVALPSSPGVYVFRYTFGMEGGTRSGEFTIVVR